MAVLPDNPRCMGITVTKYDRHGAVTSVTPAPCCEVHLLPWGHDRADLGMLRGVVRPDAETGS